MHKYFLPKLTVIGTTTNDTIYEGNKCENYIDSS